MSKTLRYAPQHEELLKRITDGLTLDEVLTSPEDYREDIRVKLDDIFMDCVDASEDVKFAEELDAMIIHFEPRQRKATWEDGCELKRE